MSVYLGGEAVFSDGINKQTQTDLYKADMIAAPISIIVLILVFGAIVAAIVPMILGGCCALIILTVLYCLGHLFSLSIFTLNIALLLGLCLNLDYSLFIINRFRNELHKHAGDTRMAIAITLATAGRAVFFSGLAVFVSLSALLFFPINILFSIVAAPNIILCVAGLPEQYSLAFFSTTLKYPNGTSIIFAPYSIHFFVFVCLFIRFAQNMVAFLPTDLQ
jgi:RND superfamily putative drug exporter